MSREDLIKLEGVVTKVIGRGTLEIECDNNTVVKGVLCGRMKKRRIRVMEGDQKDCRQRWPCRRHCCAMASAASDS